MPAATASPRPPEAYACPICKDMHRLYAVDSHGEPIVEAGGRYKTVLCSCQTGVDHERRRRRLLEMDGLSAIERTLRFESLVTAANERAIAAVQNAATRRRGLIALTGAPGTGKTTLLVAAVNAAREANVPAVYTTVTDLLDYLRRAYNPANGEIGFDARWDLLIRAEVLALDELDEFNATPWAMERFLRLIDERWRALDKCLTLVACNSALAALPDKVASRLRDGRAQTFALAGRDMRPFVTW